MAIKSFGWRSTYGMLAAVSLALGALCILLVREPAKKVIEQVKRAKVEEDNSGTPLKDDSGFGDIL
jgi:predicted MFS family arabinose efflux permease